MTLFERSPADDSAANLLERRWFAANRAAVETEAECEALSQVLDMAQAAWRGARLKLSRLEALRDALGEELGIGEEGDTPPAGHGTQHSAAA